MHKRRCVMPDRYGDTPADLDTWPTVPPPQTVPDHVWAAEHRAELIVACGLCDDDGYRGAVPCDHIDHRPTNERGSALVRAELAKIQARKTPQQSHQKADSDRSAT